jgi:sodium transport system permease protein
MKGILTKNWTLSAAFVVAISTLAYTAMLLVLASRIFSDERALFSLEGPRADFVHVFIEPPEPGLGAAFSLVAIIFVGNYYGGLLISGWSVSLGIISNQILFQLLPALGFAYWMKSHASFGANLGIQWPTNSKRALLGGLLVGLGAWLGISIPILWLQELLFTGTAQAAESLESALAIKETPIVLLLFAAAFVPAIVEEITFRGVIFGQLRARLHPLSALLLQAILFGLVHGSLYRFFPTACLGLILGWLALKTRSIWPGVIAHMLTNAIALLLETKADPSIVQNLSRPTFWAVFGLILLVLGISAVKTSDQLKANTRSNAGMG